MTATGNAASDDLDIAGLTLTKEFIDDPVLPGETATLRFTLENAHPTDDATGIIFFDDLDAALNGLAATGLPITACGGTLSGTSSLTFSGGSLAAGDPPCSFDVTVEVPANADDGVYTNTTSNVIATVGATQLALPPAIDALTVNSSLLLLSKEFTDDPATPGGTVTIEFTLNNLDAVETISDIAFTDDLGAALSGLVGHRPADSRLRRHAERYRYDQLDRRQPGSGWLLLIQRNTDGTRGCASGDFGHQHHQ